MTTNKTTTDYLATARWISENGKRALDSHQAKFIADMVVALEHRPATARERAGLRALSWLVSRARLP